MNSQPFWLAGLIKSAAPLLYTELCGFVFFRVLGTDLYQFAAALLRKTDLRAVGDNLNFSEIERLNQNDVRSPKRIEIFTQLWCLFDSLVERLAEDETWRNSLFIQSSRPRFMYSTATRGRLIKMLDSFDRTCRQRALNEVWSEHFDSAKGIFKAVAEAVRKL